MKKTPLYVTPRVGPAVKVHGGKYYLARRLIALLPPNITSWGETHFGGGNMSLNLNPEHYQRGFGAEINPNLTNLYQVIQHNVVELQQRLAVIDYTEASFQFWREYIPVGQTDWAVKFMVVNRMSRDGLGKDLAWSDRLRGGQPGDLNAWKNAIANLPLIAHQLRKMSIQNHDARVLIDLLADDSLAMLYLDPPYHPDTRTCRNAYGPYEMTPEDHRRLLGRLVHVRCRAMISGYRCPDYDQALADWRRVEFDMPNHSSQAKVKQRRIECAWMNYPEMS